MNLWCIFVTHNSKETVSLAFCIAYCIALFSIEKKMIIVNTKGNIVCVDFSLLVNSCLIKVKKKNQLTLQRLNLL